MFSVSWFIQRFINTDIHDEKMMMVNRTAEDETIFYTYLHNIIPLPVAKLSYIYNQLLLSFYWLMFTT